MKSRNSHMRSGQAFRWQQWSTSEGLDTKSFRNAETENDFLVFVNSCGAQATEVSQEGCRATLLGLPGKEVLGGQPLQSPGQKPCHSERCEDLRGRPETLTPAISVLGYRFAPRYNSNRQGCFLFSCQGFKLCYLVIPGPQVSQQSTGATRL